MKAATLRNYLAVHTWTGILGGLMLFVAFYAGALSMFDPELTQWAQPAQPAAAAAAERGAATAAADPLAADALAAAYFAQTPKPPKAISLLLPAEDQPQPQPLIRIRRDSGETRLALAADGRVQPLPAPGAAEGAAGNFVDHVHRKGGLPLPEAIAEPIVGVVSPLYALALISGVVVLLPSLVKDLFVLRLGANVKRKWLDLHNLLGVASLPIHVVMAFTAAIFCLHDFIYDAQDKLIHPQGVKGANALSTPKRPPLATPPAEWLPPSALIAHARAAAPGFTPVALDYRGLGTPQPQVMLAGHDDRHFKRSARTGYLALDPATGAVVHTGMLPGQGDSAWAAVLVSFFSLHFGSYGGEPLRVLYALAGAMGALLFYSGNLLWIESRTRRLRAGGIEQPRHVRVVAALNVGACLGCVAGLPLALVAARWGATGPIGFEALLNGAYFGAVAAGIAYALARGAQRAEPHLLAAAAAATALVPATSALAAAAPAWLVAAAPWLVKPYLRGFGFIDALSVAGALLFAALAWWQWRKPRPATPAPSVSLPQPQAVNP